MNTRAGNHSGRPTPAANVVIVGGGVIGCAIAWEVARHGLSVVVVERGRPGDQASYAAAGMLSPLAEAGGAGPFLDLLLWARSLYPEVAAALHEETGIDVGYDDAGTLYLALRDEDEAELDVRLAWQQAAGLPVERMNAEDARRLEPAISPDVRWALRFSGDHQVENRHLTRALWSAAASAGATFRLGAEVCAVLRDGDRAVGVEIDDGAFILAETVVVAGGCWSGRLGGLPRPLPVHPVRGQLAAVDAVPPPFRHVIDTLRCYLVPRADGRVIIGATTERVGFRKVVTPNGLGRLLTAAVEAAPVLGDLPVAESWAGLRPATPDGLPIIGPDPEVEGLVYATGHNRNGILLAPLTGRIVRDLITGEPRAVDLSPFAPARFASASPPDPTAVSPLE